MPAAAQSKAMVCSRSLAGIAGSNHAAGMDVCLLWVLCIVRQRSFRRADHASRGVLPSAMCLSVIFKKKGILNNVYRYVTVIIYPLNPLLTPDITLSILFVNVYIIFSAVVIPH
jgi:hypothetical protein